LIVMALKSKKEISDSTVKRQRWLRLLSLASQAKASSTNISLYLLTMRIECHQRVTR